MHLKWKLVLSSLVCFALMLGCDNEDHFINSVAESAIVGRVVPATEGITVSAWQAEQKGSAVPDSAGFFSIRGLPSGLYEVRIEMTSGEVRKIPQVVVSEGKTTSVGDIMLDGIIFPIFSIFPSDGSVASPPESNPSFLSLEQVASISLQRDIKVLPPTPGVWEQSSSRSTFGYRFIPDVQLATSETYTISFSPSLTFVNGDSLGGSFSYSFKTAEFKETQHYWRTSQAPNAVPASFTGNLIHFRYNSILDTVSVKNAITITPLLNWDATFDSDGRSFFIGVSGLGNGLTYTIIIDKTLQDIFGNAIGEADTLSFSVESFAVRFRSFPSSLTNVNPLIGRELLSFNYNSPIDKSSASAAISISPPVDLTVRIDNHGSSNFLRVITNQELLPETIYTLVISSELMSEDGITIGESEQVEFLVQPLKLLHYGLPITTFQINSWPTDTVVASEREFDFRMYFNATVNPDSIGVATSFTPPITGFWVNAGVPTSPYVVFFPTAPFALKSSQAYTITVDGSTNLLGQSSLGATEVRTLITEPILVQTINPLNGAFGVSRFTTLEVDFNAVMDQTITQAAFSLQTFEGTSVIGGFFWSFNNRLRFNPSTALLADQVYVIRVDTTAITPDGIRLLTLFESFFRTSF